MKYLLALAFIVLNFLAQGQSNTHIAFYLHGGVVTNYGDNAINSSVPEWGPYQYSRILDTLRAHRFEVISERRLPAIDDSVYVRKIARQVDSLLKTGIAANNIVLIGASAGWNIVLHVSARLKNSKLNFALMGGCWPEDYKGYLDIKLYGHFLSIIEATDPHGACARLFEKRKQVKSFREIQLNNGLSHGFICKPYACWLNPVLEWFQTKADNYEFRSATLADGY